MRIFKGKLAGYAIAALATACGASGATLMPGQVLELRFSVSNPLCPFGPCDTLLVFPGTYGFIGSPVATVDLYDGDVLLGSRNSHPGGCCQAVFRSEDSAFRAGGAEVVDFEPILDGLGTGIINFRVRHGALHYFDPSAASIVLGHATGRGNVFGGTGLTLESVRVLATPESSNAWLLLTGIAALAAFRNRAARAREGQQLTSKEASPAGRAGKMRTGQPVLPEGTVMPPGKDECESASSEPARPPVRGDAQRSRRVD